MAGKTTAKRRNSRSKKAELLETKRQNSRSKKAELLKAKKRKQQEQNSGTATA